MLIRVVMIHTYLRLGKSTQISCNIYIYIYIYIRCAIENKPLSNNNKYKHSQHISATRFPLLNSTFQVRTKSSSSCMKNYFGNQYQ